MSALDELIETYEYHVNRPPNFTRSEVRAELAQLRDNYKASQELLAIREEQVGELLKEKAELRAAKAEAREVIEIGKQIGFGTQYGNGYYDIWGPSLQSYLDAAAAWLEKYPKEKP